MRKMVHTQIRFHGRGGQGVVTSAEILAKAAHMDGNYVQAYPMFGIERTGAPVESYCKISDSFIRDRSHIYNPDYVIVLDDTLFSAVNVMNGLSSKGLCIANTDKEFDDPRIKTINVTEVARRILGRNIVNTGVLGAFIAFTKIVSADSVLKALEDQFRLKPEMIEKNKEVVRTCFERSEAVLG